MTSGSMASGSPNPAGGVRGRPLSHAMLAPRDALIPIGESEPIPIVRGEPPAPSSVLVSPSGAPFQRHFVLCLVPLESQAGRDLLPRFDRVAEFPVRLITSIIAGWHELASGRSWWSLAPRGC